jgi:hypothetical protein
VEKQVMYNTLAIQGSTLPNTRRAGQLFNEALRAGKLQKLFAFVTGRSRKLLELKENKSSTQHGIKGVHGTTSVPVNQIRGTMNKADSFDLEFLPLQERSRQRWVGIALRMMRAEHLPPVELIQIGEDYYVSDGHHRISVARALNHDYIDAVVVAS